jgi:hypothetical protein
MQKLKNSNIPIPKAQKTTLTTTPKNTLFRGQNSEYMEKLRNVVRTTAAAVRRLGLYLGNLEWTEKKQDVCRFCDVGNFDKILYQASPEQLVYHAST